MLSIRCVVLLVSIEIIVLWSQHPLQFSVYHLDTINNNNNWMYVARKESDKRPLENETVVGVERVWWRMMEPETTRIRNVEGYSAGIWIWDFRQSWYGICRACCFSQFYAARMDCMIWKMAEPHTTKMNKASSQGPTGYWLSLVF